MNYKKKTIKPQLKSPVVHTTISKKPLKMKFKKLYHTLLHSLGLPIVAFEDKNKQESPMRSLRERERERSIKDSTKQCNQKKCGHSSQAPFNHDCKQKTDKTLVYKQRCSTPNSIFLNMSKPNKTALIPAPFWGLT